MKRTLTLLVLLCFASGAAGEEAAKHAADTVKKTTAKSEPAPKRAALTEETHTPSEPADIEPMSWGNVKALWGN